MSEKRKTGTGPGISKQQSSQLQGLAILLLIYHHFFNDLAIYGERLAFWSPEWVVRFAWFGKICVGIFAFVTGYGMCRVMERKEGPAMAIGLRQILQFLIRYWVIFLLFMGCLFSLGRKTFELKEFLQNFFCISSSYNGAFWYVQQYVLMLLFLAMAEAFLRFLKAIWKREKNGSVLGKGWQEAAERIVSVLLVLTCGIFVIAAIVSPNVGAAFHQFLDVIRIAFVLTCFMGYFAAKLHAFEWIFEKLNSLRYVMRLFLGVFLLFLVGTVRIWLADSPAYAKHDFLFVPVFVTGILLCLNGVKWLEMPLERLGKTSVYVWLTHLFVFELTNAFVLRFVHSHFLFYLVETVLCIFVGSTCLFAERGIKDFPKAFQKKK